MSLNFNAAFQSEFTPASPKKTAVSVPAGDGFMAAMEQLINEEHKRTVTVGASAEQQGAAMQKNKFLIEEGKNLKFPMDDDIIQDLLTTVKGKIKQLKELRQQLDLD